LRVDELVKRDAVFIERLLLVDGVSGETVIDIPLDGRFRARYRNPYAVTHRADIHLALLDGCRARPELIELRTERRVTGFHVEDDGVAVEIADGRRIDAWRWSVPMAGTRRCASRRSATASRRYRGTRATAVLKVEEMPADLRWPAATLWAGPNSHIVRYPLGG
jgi:hypothetical protein